MRPPAAKKSFFRLAGPRAGVHSVPQVVTGVPAGMLLEIVLVELLRGPELGGGDGLGGDRTLPLAPGLDAGPDLLGDPPLLLALIEDGRAVLGSLVVPLAVHGRWVVHAAEGAREVLVRQPIGVEDDPHGFGVTGSAGLYFIVGGGGRRAAGA